MKSVSIISTLLFIISISFNATFKKNELTNHDSDKYKAYYIAKLIYKYRPDTVWHSAIDCGLPDDLDKMAIMEIDSLVNLSYLRLWTYSDEGRDGKGSREDFIIDPLCVAYELLEVYHSSDLDLLAKTFEERVKKSQKMKN